MTTTILTLLILYGVYRWSISWIEYYSKLDSRLGSQYGGIVTIIMYPERETLLL